MFFLIGWAAIFMEYLIHRPIKEIEVSFMLFMLLIVIIICIIAFIVIKMFRQAFEDRVLYHDMKMDNFPKSMGEIKIFFISDIHRRLIGENIITEVKKSHVDLIIIGGDLTEKGVPLSRVRENIQRLRTLGPTYFVWGNNDYETDYHELDAMLLAMGVKILDNSAVSFIGEEGERLTLLGTDDLSRERDRLDLALSDAEDDGFKLLVSHDPAIIEKIEEHHHISLVLCGHTHGGQIRIFGFGPYELGGIKTVKGLKLFVSNGYGTTALPLRLGAKAETHIVTLSATK